RQLGGHPLTAASSHARTTDPRPLEGRYERTASVRPTSPLLRGRLGTPTPPREGDPTPTYAPGRGPPPTQRAPLLSSRVASAALRQSRRLRLLEVAEGRRLEAEPHDR